MSTNSTTDYIRITAVVLLLMGSAFVAANPSKVNDAIASSIETDSENDYQIVGLKIDEKWPILRISFPGKTFPNSLLADIFEGDLSAQQYFSEISGGKTQLTPTIVDGVWESPHPESHWGEDSADERDSGGESGGARELAKQAILSLLKDSDPSEWDLDGDYVIDRLLILHSGQPQEEGGSSNAIWSHFSPFYEPVQIGEYRFEHYTMASVYGGLGVIAHEMLHQMGALDLYDVHSDSPTKAWYGLGDWDVMASGNWISNGDRPSLPSSSTLELIGALENKMIMPENDSNITLEPISLGGSTIKLGISPEENVWITLRSDVGFDSGLPGHGILVEHQDVGFGDIDSNLVNTDPTRPWVKIVEADGDDALLRAIDYGSAGDVFVVGDRFGHTGTQIWDNRGRLAPWTVTVTSVSRDNATVEFDYVGDPVTIVNVPRSPIVLLPNESVFAEVNSDDNCQIVADLSISNDGVLEGSSLNYSNTKQDEYSENTVKLLDLSASSLNEGEISGYIGCKDRPLTILSMKWIVVNHRLSDDALEAKIAWDEESTVSLYPESEGKGPRTYSISVDGPASRISHSTTSGVFYPGDSIDLDIDPAGLLEPRMVARGVLVIVDSNNIEQRIPIVLNSNGELPFGPLNWLAIPSNAVSAIFVLMALSIATGKRRGREDPIHHEENQEITKQELVFP